MYYCQKCGKLTRPRESGGMIVVGQKTTEHFGKNKFGEKVFFGKGMDISKEIHVCRSCMDEHEKAKAAQLQKVS